MLAHAAPSRNHRPSHSVRAAVFAALPLLALHLPAALADDAPAAAAAPADQAPAVLQEVTVTATRRAESESKVPISITAISAQDMEMKGIKDIADIARFTPGVTIDTSGTNNISIRGISSSGGAGTTGIYIDDTPIQMRGLAFNPDEEVPKMFDIDRVEILRGPQGTLFGAGSEGGTVRYITVQPSLIRTTEDARAEVDYTQGGAPSYEAGAAVGGPLIDDKLGARVTLWYRRDGGWIDTTDSTTLDPAVTEKNANYRSTYLARLAFLWAVSDNWTVTPGIYFQKKDQHDLDAFWACSSYRGALVDGMCAAAGASGPNATNDYNNGDPTLRGMPDTFYLPSLKIEGDLGFARFISNTSLYHRQEQTGYEGTEYNLGFYQTFAADGYTDINGNALQSLAPMPLLNGTGVHLPASIADYASPNSIDNHQQNFIQELRLVSADPNARLIWTTGLFFSENRQSYLEQIHDPMLNAFSEAVWGEPYTNVFWYTDANGNNDPATYVPAYPNDSYFLGTHATDKQYAWYGEATFAFTDALKATVGLRESHMSFAFDSVTGGPQLFSAPINASVGQTENAFTPKVNLDYQITDKDMVYATYAKGFRPGGGNNPLPYAACSVDLTNFGLKASPESYDSDHVDSFEVGTKDNIDNRVKVAASVYYIIWHNIQQTVVPPICQISFITNLGEAVAKGADLQIEWAATDSLSADVALGYTDARYTKNAGFPNTQPGQTNTPIALDGDAITGESGQPNAPFTAAVGLEYDLTLGQHDSFVRLDWEYEAHSSWLSPSEDPNSAQYDPANFVLPSFSYLSLRAGMKFGGLSVQPFIENLTNNHALTNYDWSIDDGLGDSRLLRGWTSRPRTFGITFTYHH